MNDRFKPSSCFEIRTDSRHARLRELVLDEELLTHFLIEARQYCLGELIFSPILRCRLAQMILEHLGASLAENISGIIHDPSLGAMVIKIPSSISHNQDDLIRLSTALVHTFGFCQIDDASKEFFHIMNLQHQEQDSKVFTNYTMEPYKELHLHVDGVFAPSTPDFLLMGKVKEQGVTGGMTKLLHIDDFEQLDSFVKHPSCKSHYYYRGGKKYNAEYIVMKPLFTSFNNLIYITHSFSTLIPETYSDAEFILSLHKAIESSCGVVTFPLFVSELIILNNHRWLHGRQAFSVNENLDRVLFRMRGMFWENHSPTPVVTNIVG